jgi:hypothetical protein
MRKTLPDRNQIPLRKRVETLYRMNNAPASDGAEGATLPAIIVFLRKWRRVVGLEVV